ncbi:MAG: TetR/AcrR family transcriptional regulator [Proteobacteria bacterium]|nr:TetR/AcrR family transcriptional regulator [Pseudomonadota bacterium]
MVKKKSRPSDVKERIYQEAIRLFGENGFEGTSIQTIADAVGIRKPSLLYHFSSKEELREEVINALVAHWKNELPNLLANTTCGHDRFSSAITALVRFFIEDRNRARMAIRELLDRPMELVAMTGEHLSPWAQMIVEYIRLGQGSGMIKKEVEPESYITQILVMVIGTVALGSTAASIVGSKKDGMEPMIQELVRIAREALFIETNTQPQPQPQPQEI